MERKVTMLRFPAKLYERLIREVGELTMKTGKRVSINELVTKILERHYKQKARGRRK